MTDKINSPQLTMSDDISGEASLEKEVSLASNNAIGAAQPPKRKLSDTESSLNTAPTPADSPERESSSKRRSLQTASLTVSEAPCSTQTVADACNTEPSSLPNTATASKDENTSKRLGPKRHYALLMSYCGDGYRGMQTNEKTKTIEGELFKALVEIGSVSIKNSVDQKKIGFQRAARTDKGVHAIGQVVNAKLVTDHLDSNFLSALNQTLPSDIRVWDAIRVKKSFNSKNFCDSRIYSYCLPTYVLSPLDDWPERLQHPPDPSTFTTLDASQLHVDRTFRMSTELWERVVRVWKGYEGTHRFHNFTVGKALTTEASAQRYILRCDVAKPMWVDGMGEWLCLTIQGQSFMLHQIRKMVGFLILMLKTRMPIDVFPQILAQKQKLCVPKAPSPGLWLEQCVFDRHNENLEGLPEKRAAIDFEKLRNQTEAFKREFIFPSLFKQELEDKCFAAWMETILRTPQLFAYLNPQATVPENYTLFIDFDKLSKTTEKDALNSSASVQD